VLILNHDGVLWEWEDSEGAAAAGGVRLLFLSFLLAHLMVSIGLLCILLSIMSIVSLYPSFFFIGLVSECVLASVCLYFLGLLFFLLSGCRSMDLVIRSDG